MCRKGQVACVVVQKPSKYSLESQGTILFEIKQICILLSLYQITEIKIQWLSRNMSIWGQQDQLKFILYYDQGHLLVEVQYCYRRRQFQNSYFIDYFSVRIHYQFSTNHTTLFLHCTLQYLLLSKCNIPQCPILYHKARESNEHQGVTASCVVYRDDGIEHVPSIHYWPTHDSRRSLDDRPP